MPGNPISFPEIATAIGNRWKSRGLDATIKGGIWSNAPPERTARPYAIIGSLGETPLLHTSKARYEDIVVTIEVVADNMDALQPLLGAVKAAYGDDSLTVATSNGSVFLKMLYARTTYLEEANYLRGICEYTVRIKQDRF